ncbi:MAG: phosphohistidine phosphatase SixA [Desulfobulbaceae bacterium]|nr:phosphohistidine phosphatase SixA [Desulfobulbaceae bacterium]
MAVYLVQHGKSLAKEIDPEQGLSDEGIRDAKRIAEVAGHYKIPVDIIAHSGKKRALQTAEIYNDMLQPSQGIIALSGIKPLDDVPAFAETLDNDKNMMLVSHLPFLEKLTSCLVAGNENICVFKFQNGGIVCLDKLPETSWVIKWALMPQVS